MCDFCENKIGLNSAYLDARIDYNVPFFGTALTIYNILNKANQKSFNNNVNVQFKINYCPLCGRKIGDEEK